MAALEASLAAVKTDGPKASRGANGKAAEQAKPKAGAGSRSRKS